MRCHTTFTGAAHTKAFFRLGQDDGWLSLVRFGSCKGGVEFPDIMATATQQVNVVIGHVLHQRGTLGVGIKKLCAIIVAVF